MEPGAFVSALILAAGQGVRMGRVKQLLPLRGRPLLSHAIEAARASRVDEVVVVLGHQAARVRAELGDLPGVRFVDNRDYRRGQSSSLSLGLAALDPRAQAAVVLLGDQPTVTADDIDRVVDGFADGDAVAARAAYEDAGELTAGHPTVLGRVLWDEVGALEGDLGAREILARYRDRVVQVALGKAPPPDLDTPAEYRMLAGAASSSC